MQSASKFQNNAGDGSQGVSIPSTHQRFVAARRVMLVEYGRWLEDHPSSADVTLEVVGTSSVMKQLRLVAEDAAHV